MGVNKISIENNVKDWVANYIEEEFEFREHQFECIVNIIKSILDNPETNYICEAPTGSGKSLINIISAGVLAEYYNMTSYILVSDLFLWEQYDKFIQNHKKLHFGSIKGQTGNYTCALNKEDIRKMTPREWARLQGFPDSFKLILSDTHLYKQFGNSVVVPLMTDVAGLIVNKLKELDEGKNDGYSI